MFTDQIAYCCQANTESFKFFLRMKPLKYPIELLRILHIKTGSVITKRKNEVTIFTKAANFIVTQVLQLVTNLADTVNRQYSPSLSPGCVLDRKSMF